MTIPRSVANFVAAILLVPSALAAVQNEESLQDLLASKSRPLTIKIAEIPADFMAVEFSSGTSGGLADLFGGPLSLMMVGMAGHTGSGDPNRTKMMNSLMMSQLSWTKGETLKMNGKTFVVLQDDDGHVVSRGTESAVSRLPRP